MRILYLTLKKEWFDLIKSGEKTVEFREMKSYWTARLQGKEFDVVHFRNGYRPDSPTMIVEWQGMHLQTFQGKQQYAIILGKILQYKSKLL